MTEKVDIALWRQCMVAVPRRPIPPHALPFRCRLVDGCQVLIVDGASLMLRPDKPKEDDEHPHMDFTQGANDLEAGWVRREFGQKVLLLDGRLPPTEWAFDLYHEAMERRLMAKGMGYNAAHNRVNAQEKQLRLMARRRQVGRRAVS